VIRADDVTILLVDENPINIRVLHQSLRDIGRLLFAISGIDALKILEGHRIDLVLLDINMPGLSGFDTCSEIKRRWPDIPVVFVTSHQDVETEVKALASGGIDFIQKPINPPAIQARVRAHLTMKLQGDVLRNLIHLDPLTEISNRRGLDERLYREWKDCTKEGASLSLLMIDVDYFKRYNDHYGHPAGDRCLQIVAKAISDSVRNPCFVARYGGEEFAVLMPKRNSLEGLDIAHRIFDSIRLLREPHEKSEVSPYVSVSIGLSTTIPKSDDVLSASALNPGLTVAAQLIEAADQALYRAKIEGRNRVAH
jgi:diguanylate cyclase (GGDEF)-like protein